MRHITLTPPRGLFAAVQIETLEGEVVGAETCLNPDSTPKTSIGATVKTHDEELVIRWVCEDSSQGFALADYKHGRVRARR